MPPQPRHASEEYIHILAEMKSTRVHSHITCISRKYQDPTPLQEYTWTGYNLYFLG